MALNEGQVGSLATIKLGLWTPARLRDISFSGMSRGFADITVNNNIYARSYIPHKTFDGGEISAQLVWGGDSGTDIETEFRFNSGGSYAPDTGEEKALVVDFGTAFDSGGVEEATAQKLATRGFITGLSITVPHEDAVLGELTFKVTDDWVWSDAVTGP